MPLFWFVTGAFSTLALLAASLPWLRKTPHFATLPALPWPASAAALGIVIVLLAGSPWLGHVERGRSSVPASAPEASAAGVSGPAGLGFGAAVKAFDATAAAAPATDSPAKSNAGSMDTAVVNLQARLAKGGGSPGDWELLAKSFEFLGRPADAARALQHQLPAAQLPAASKSAPAGGTPADGRSPAAASASGVAVSGEVTLAPALAAKAADGATLFIVAKSVDAPGAPVAVIRGSVGRWPMQFKLDDSQSMMPGHNLSSAGRVTVEARISQKGQPIPASGDLQGTSGVILPSDHPSLRIVIDHVIS